MRTLSVIAFLSAAATAQNIDLRGIVSNASGKPINGASVLLVSKSLKSTTGSDGSYSIASSLAVRSGAELSFGLSFSDGVLSFTVPEASPLSIDVFRADGGRSLHQSLDMVTPGLYRIALAEQEQTSGIRFAKVRIGDRVSSIRFLSQGTRSEGSITSIPGSLARIAATVDTLRVSAAGYVTKSVALPSYTGTLNITLDSASAAGSSAGCGKVAALKSGTISITSGSDKRSYILDIPANYDPNHPYRLVFGLHWMGGTMTDVATGQTVKPLNTWMYFGLKRLAGTSTIFVAPQGIGNGWANTNNRDLVFIDDILKQVKSGLCIDTTRMFAGGFSFGGGMSLALACDRPGVFRAIAPQSGSLALSGCKDGTKPTAILAAAGTETYSSMLTAVQKFAKNNGCSVVTPPKPAAGSTKHVCTDFTGCKAGYPARWCPFDAGHIAAPTDGQTSDNGDKTWLPAEIWKFYTQF